MDVPYEKTQRYEGAINDARSALGLKAIGIGYPYLWVKHALPTPPPDDPGLRRPSGVAVDASGHVYVSDTDHHRIVKFNRALEPVNTWGTFGRSNGQFQFPRGIAVTPNGTVYVADWGNHRIQVFTTEGLFLAKLGAMRYEDFGNLFCRKTWL